MLSTKMPAISFLYSKNLTHLAAMQIAAPMTSHPSELRLAIKAQLHARPLTRALPETLRRHASYADLLLTTGQVRTVAPMP
jgi:hypothetical protein